MGYSMPLQVKYIMERAQYEICRCCLPLPFLAQDRVLFAHRYLVLPPASPSQAQPSNLNIGCLICILYTSFATILQVLL